MPGPEEELGATCPDGGNFYVCEDNKPSSFLGCCTSDPCATDDGNCPDDKLRAASFEESAFDLVLPQECVSSLQNVAWYTCGANDPPFMGCCGVNPCDVGECPLEELAPAKLSSDKDNAAIFLSDSTASATKTSEPTSSATGSPKDGDHEHGEGLSHGALAGIAVGGSIGGLLVVGLLVFWYMKRRDRGGRDNRSTYEPYAGQSHQSHQEAKLAPSPYTPDSAAFGGFASSNQHDYHEMQGQRQTSPPHYGAHHGYGPGSAGFSTSPYNSQTGTPVHPLFRDNGPGTAELDGGEQAEGMKFAPSSLTSYGRPGGESELSGMSAVSERHESYAAELEDSRLISQSRR